MACSFDCHAHYLFVDAICFSLWVCSHGFDGADTGARQLYTRCARIFRDQKGDIVIFEHGGRLLVKRVAALPGESVDLSAITYMTTLEIPIRDTDVLIVPEDCYYLLGDNTQDSIDSRYWDDPFVNREQIVAKMIYPAK